MRGYGTPVVAQSEYPQLGDESTQNRHGSTAISVCLRHWVQALSSLSTSVTVAKHLKPKL
jgi:hypothetical protein